MKSKFDSSSLSNLVDADPSALRPYIILTVAAFVVLVGGAGYYTWHTQSLQDTEEAANDALYSAKTPADKIKVADNYPSTLTAPRALVMAGKDDFEAGDFAGSLTVNQRVLSDYPKSLCVDEAELGEAAAYAEIDKPDDALRIYMDIARQRTSSPYSPYAYLQAAYIYQAKHDTASLRAVLDEGLSTAQSFTPAEKAPSQFTQMLFLMRASLPPQTTPSPVPTTSTNSISPVVVSPLPSTTTNSVSPIPSKAPVSPSPVSK